MRTRTKVSTQPVRAFCVAIALLLATRGVHADSVIRPSIDFTYKTQTEVYGVQVYQNIIFVRAGASYTQFTTQQLRWGLMIVYCTGAVIVLRAIVSRRRKNHAANRSRAASE